MMDIRNSKLIKEDKDFKYDRKQINPIKNYTIQLNEKNADSFLIKRQRIRSLQFELIEGITYRTLRRLAANLKSQKKFQSLSLKE